MRYLIPWCGVLVALTAAARAGDAPTGTVIPLNVRPMAAPKPALRYALLPELGELRPGNPLPALQRCLLTRAASGKDSFSRQALRQADEAARLDRPDWQILERMKREGYRLILSDVQGLRALAQALNERLRLEISRGQFDDAMVTAKTLFAMSRHLSEHPTLIGNLVGMAIASLAIESLQEMVQQPGCPNLYWALTNLPDPLVPVTRGVDGERLILATVLADLDRRAPMTDAQVKKVLRVIDELRGIAGQKTDNNARAWLTAQVKNADAVRTARQRLVESGLPEDLVGRFSADQAVLLDDQRRFEITRDNHFKVMALPYWQVQSLLGQPDSEEKPTLLSPLLPAVMNVRRAQDRVTLRLALLRHVEALRMYAAEHAGRLPDELADVGVPLPNDPFTGQPFGYDRDGATARIRSTPHKGLETNAAYNFTVELTVRN